MRQAPALSFDTTDPDFVRDPWDRYEQIRELGGVIHNERVNRWMVADFEPTRSVLTTPSVFGSEKGQAEQAAVFGGPTMEFYDGPHHDRIRAIWSHDFKPRTLADLREVTAAIVRERMLPVVDRLRDGETVEVVGDLTRGIPTAVIAHMLAVEPDMVDQFSAWSDAMGASAEGYSSPGGRGAELIAAGRTATAELNDYIRVQIGSRGESSPSRWDLISTMVAHDYADRMTQQEIVASNTQLVFAGNETTAKLLTQIVATLAAHPDQRRAIRSDPSLIPAAVEEVHRFETITHSVFRDVIVDDAEVAGVAIPFDARITLLLGAANRDPHRWARPDHFDVFRKKLPHLGYAFGLHSCLGMNLARLEAQIFLEELIDALPDWDVQRPLEYGTNYTVRGPSRLMMSVV